MVGENGVLAAGHDFGGHKGCTLEIISGEKQWAEEVSGEKAWDECYHQFAQIIGGDPVPHRFQADGHDALANMKVAAEVIAQCRAT